jgi:biopolymer transport protein ExbD
MNFTNKQSAIRLRGHRLNLTPMIDVVFLLIIFFMVVSQFSSQERTAMALPQAKNSFTPEIATEQSKLIVNIMPSGEIKIDDISCDQERLSQILLGHTDSKIIIRSDKNCTWVVLKPVLDTCRKAGISTTNIAVIDDQQN